MTRRGTLVVTAVAAVVVLSAATLSFITFRGDAAHDDEEPIRAPQRVSLLHGETVITLDPAAQRLAGIQTARLQQTLWGQRLRAYGTVLDPQPLTELANRYVAARAQAETASARLDSSRREFERATRLFRDEENISQAQLQASEAAYRSDRAAFSAARSELDTLAATARQSWGAVVGTAVSKATPLLARLTARQELLLQVTLRPGEIAASAPVDAFVQRDDGSRVPLRYVSPAARTDPRIQGESLLFAAPGTAGLLPGMNVLVSLPGARSARGALVPRSAIVWTQGAAWAYVRSGTSRFVRTGVATDAATSAGYVVSNLPGDTEVVVQGAQMLLSEERRAEARVTD